MKEISKEEKLKTAIVRMLQVCQAVGIEIPMAQVRQVENLSDQQTFFLSGAIAQCGDILIKLVNQESKENG